MVLPRSLSAFAPPAHTVGLLPRAAGAAPSVLQSLNLINERLDRLLSELRAYSDADVELRTIAHELVSAIGRDPDVALACIFLNQVHGRYAVRHCLETAIVACVVAQGMGKAPLELLTIAAAALTMNVGMMRQIESFQSKDAALSSEERAIILRHPAESADLLRCAGVTDEEWIAVVLLHHENEDGSGYPEGRLGAAIPQNARLVGMADRYCACVSARNYRRSMLPPLAMRKLCADHALAVDAGLTQHFAEHLGEHPPGTRVRLSNGEVGVVSRRRGQEGALEVHALRSADGENLAQPEARQIGARCTVEEALHEDQLRLRFSMKQIWGEVAGL
jgi:HD-GYP domain-containing protein (c-di-GMP phosphodiesterase class II)